MNNITICGRLTKDVELRYTPSTGKAVARFTVAVNRPFAKKEDDVKADFFNVVAWGKIAEATANWTKKGKQILVTGRMQNNIYTDKNNIKHYEFELVAKEIEFIDWDKKDKYAEEPPQFSEE